MSDTEETPDASDDGAAPEESNGDAAAPEDDADLPVAAAAAPVERDLEAEIAAAKADTQQFREKMLRVAADFENYRKRSSREVHDAQARGSLGAIKDLLPVFDNLERATGQVDENADVKSMLDGLRMVHRQFLDVLARLGITRVAGVGAPFDPALHESIQYDHSDEHAAGLVMVELQPGYQKGDQLLRPALVVVSRGPKPAAVDEPPAADSPAEASE